MAAERFVRQDREIAEQIAQSFGGWHQDRTYVLSKLTAGHYRVGSPMLSVDEPWAREQPYFSNIKKGSKYSGEMPSKWYADIRRARGGELQRYAGIWNTMDEAIQEAIFILNGM